MNRYLITAAMDVPNGTAPAPATGRTSVRREQGFIPSDRLVLAAEK